MGCGQSLLWFGGRMYIDRQVFPELMAQSESNKITILTGARQVGKTTLMKKLCKDLSGKGKCLFLDLDIFSNYEKVSTYEKMIGTLTINGYTQENSGMFYLFLDEFQRYADISLVLKNLYDHHKNIKIYASGSSSLVINGRVQESLAGRKRMVRIYPLNFTEFLLFKGETELNEKLEKISEIASREIHKLIPEAYQRLEEFMIFGGYPEVVLSEQREKREILSSIFDLYVSKDLVDYLNIEKLKSAKTLIQLLSVNNGCEIKYSSIASSSGIDEKTAKNYLEILQETFLITIHTPYFTNKKREIVKQPKVYYLDSGVRNFFINNFNSMSIRKDAAFLFEGYVISELIKQGEYRDSIKFWRTKTQHEVDVIIDRGRTQIPVEIKYKTGISPSDLKGLRQFKGMYSSVEASFLINLGDNTSIDSTKLLSPFELRKIP